MSVPGLINPITVDNRIASEEILSVRPDADDHDDNISLLDSLEN